MEEKYKENIRPILDCFDKCRIHLKKAEIEIPCICSVGCQSAGKSSVLESITGIQLPRGEGVVTRCPIMIQLRNTNKNQSAKIQYEDISEDIKMEEIAKKILEYQEKVLEKDEVLSDKAITLIIEKYNSYDLTLIDLPGITHKTDETFKKITDIIIKYLTPTNTIALFVHASTFDIDANECLSLIRKISDEGRNDIFKRTIPIFTKPDDALKTNVNTLINNFKVMKEFNFLYSPIIVLNRSQEEIDGNVEIGKVMQREKEILNNPLIKENYMYSYGLSSLIDLLLNIQKDKLLGSLPTIIQQVKEKLKEYNSNLEKFPKGCKNRKEFNLYLRKYCDDYDIKIKDTLINVKSFLSTNPSNKNSLETKIRKELFEFKETFTKQIYKYLSEEFYEKVDLILKDSIRLKPENFYGEECWDNIIHEEIKNVFNECVKLIEKISKMIEDEIKEPFDECFKSNNGFYRKIKQILDELVDSNKNNCIKFFENLKEIECSRNFTINERYMDFTKKIQNKIKENRGIKVEESENNNKKEEGNSNNEEEKENEEVKQDDEPKNKKEEDSFFYFYTNLDRDLFIKFTIKLRQIKNPNDSKIIEIMCSIFSYMKIFLDRFLDYLSNGILFYLLESFLGDNLTKHIKYEFADMDDKTVTNIMGDSQTRSKIEQIERKKLELETVYKQLSSL